MINIISCGPDKGIEKLYKCIACDFESDDLENFGVSMCWECIFPIQEEENE